MIRRAIAILAWLIAGHVVLGGLYWALLDTPESNVFMLTLSALLVVAMALWTGLVQGVGLMGWQHSESVMGLLKGALTRVGWFLPALALFGVIWWLTGLLLGYFATRAGEIDAWFIANAGWVGTAWLHSAVRWALYFVRFAVGVSLALAVFAAGLRDGWAGVSRAAWMNRACSWRTLAVVGVALLAIWAAPWQLASWRPSGLPSTWVQPAFAGAKLIVLFVLANALWAVVLWVIGRTSVPAGASALPGASAAEPSAPASDESAVE